jgi:hypothetical protein
VGRCLSIAETLSKVSKAGPAGAVWFAITG